MINKKNVEKVKRLGLLAFIFMLLGVVSFAMLGCQNASSAQIEGVKEAYNLKLNQSDFNFLEGVTATLNKKAVTPNVDVSTVDFTKSGEYDIIFSVEGLKKEAIVNIYDVPEFFGEDMEVTQGQLDESPLAGVGAFDSFGRPLNVTILSGLDKNSDGLYALGKHSVKYQTVDCVGNIAVFDCNITVLTSQEYFGRKVNGSANIDMWSMGDVARKAGNLVVWDTAEDAYRLDNYLTDVTTPSNYGGYASFFFGGADATFLTFGSQWYNAIKFEWKRPAGAVEDISFQTVGYRLKSTTATREWQESILPLTTYNSHYWLFSFLFKTPTTEKVSSMYVRNIQLVEKETYFAEKKFNGEKYLSNWSNAHLNDGSSVNWSDSEQAFELKNGYNSSAQGHGAFNFGYSGLLDCAYGTNENTPIYDAIMFTYKQTNTTNVSINFEGFPINPINYPNMTDWGTMIIPLKWSNKFGDPQPLGMTHHFASLSFFAPYGGSGALPTIYVKDIEFVNTKDYTHNGSGAQEKCIFNGEKYLSWWGFDDKSIHERNGDTITYDAVENAYKFKHIRANALPDFSFGGTADASLITRLYKNYGYNKVTFKIKYNGGDNDILRVNSQTAAAGCEKQIVSSPEWQIMDIKIYTTTDVAFRPTFTKWEGKSAVGEVEFWVKDIEFSTI